VVEGGQSDGGEVEGGRATGQCGRPTPPFGGCPTRGRHSRPPCAPTTQHGACVPVTSPGQDLLEAARTRQAVDVVAESVARAQSWPKLAFVKVTDIPPSNVAAARGAGETSPPVSEFTAIARELAATAGRQ